MAAVRWEGTALRYVHDQTPQICLTAVRNKQFVRNQTPQFVWQQFNGMDMHSNMSLIKLQICLAAEQRCTQIL